MPVLALVGVQSGPMPPRATANHGCGPVIGGRSPLVARPNVDGSRPSWCPVAPRPSPPRPSARLLRPGCRRITAASAAPGAGIGPFHPSALPPAPPPPVPLTLSPPDVYKRVLALAADKAATPSLRYLALSFVGGAFIGFGALLIITVAGGGRDLHANLNPGYANFIRGAIGLPVGFALAVLMGGELYPGNVFILGSGWLSGAIRLRDAARGLGLWCVDLLHEIYRKACMLSPEWPPHTRVV